MTAKKTVGLRLSEPTIKELESLAKRFKVSQADVVSVLVRCVYNNGDIDGDSLEELFEIAARC